MTQPNESADRKSAEIRAPTVDEAVARGLVRLGGLSRAEVKIEVIEEPRSGILGFGASDALVRLTALAPGETATASPGSGRTAEAPSRARSDSAEPGARPSRQAPRGRDKTTAEPRARASTPAEPPPAQPSAVPPSPRGGDEDDWGPVPSLTKDAEPSHEPTRGRGARGGSGRREPTPRREGTGRRSDGDQHEAAATAVDPDLAADAALEVVGGLLERLGYEGVRVSRSNAWLPDDLSDDRSLVIAAEGGGCEALLEHDLEGLRALQFVARLLLARRADGWVNLLIDINGDRARRVQELVDLAKQSATLVERDGRPVSLPPMSAYERRVVHIVLKDHPVVATQSIGSGEVRKVTVRRLDQMLPEL